MVHLVTACGSLIAMTRPFRIIYWNFSLLEHPTINTKEFQDDEDNQSGIPA